MGLTRYIGGQFANPQGFGGKLSTYFMNRLNQRQYHAVMRAYDMARPGRVLDIGFGNGYLLEKLAQKGNAQFCGVDISPDMVRQAAKRNAEAIAEGRLELREGDVSRLPYPDGHFDFIYTVNTVYFWPDFEKGHREVLRTLRPGGVFVNVFYTKEWLEKLAYTKYDFATYTPQKLVEAAGRLGFVKPELAELKRNSAYCLKAYVPDKGEVLSGV